MDSNNKTGTAKGAGEMFAKALRKQSVRAKEKVLEKLGKIDRTQDDLFDEYVANITKQQNNVLRLQKEVKNYLQCVKAMTVASASLNKVVADIYESDWSGQTEVQSVENRLQLTREERVKSLNEDVTNLLAQYLTQFPDAQAKIAKRNRKLVDYDAARYELNALMNGPKRNEMKIAKAQDDLTTAQKMYERLNEELHKELPELYESRIGFFGNLLKVLWEAEAVFHNDAAKCFEDLRFSAENLLERSGGSYHFVPVIRKQMTLNISSPITHEAQNSSSEERRQSPKENGSSKHFAVHYDAKPRDVGSIEEEINNVSIRETQPAPSKKPTENPPPVPAERNSSIRMYPELPATDEKKPVVEKRIVRTRVSSTSEDDHENDSGRADSRTDKIVEEIHDKAEVKPVTTPRSTKTPPTVLYKVKAANPYMAEDTDELSFEVGEVIRVIPYPNPEEQDEGWLMGIKESDGETGVFPANFTKPLSP